MNLLTGWKIYYQFLSGIASRQRLISPRGTVIEKWFWTWQTMEEKITISWLPLLERISFLESRRKCFRQPKFSTNVPHDRAVSNYKIFDQHWESPDSFNELLPQVPQRIAFMDPPPTDCRRQKWLNLRIVVRLQLKCDGTHGDAREGKWRGNWQREWAASTLHTTSEHGVFSVTTADAHTLAASSRLNWCPRRFKWTRPIRRKTKSGFRARAITFQLASTMGPE